MSRAFRVVIGGRGLDLQGAFAHASASDWAALIGATGRNPFAIGKRLGELERLKSATEDEQTAMLEGPIGSRFVETVGDLVFLARRMEGDREPGTDRPLTYETSVADTPVMEVIAGFTAAMIAAGVAGEGEAEPDPTRARTVSGPGGKRQRGKRNGRKT